MTLSVDYKLLRVDHVINEGTRQIQVSNSFHLPYPTVDISNVIVTVKDVQAKVIDDKVVVEGKVHTQLYYVDESHLVRHGVEEFDFNSFVDIPGATPGMEGKVNVRVEHVDCDLVVPKGDKVGQTVEQDVILEIFVKVLQPVEVTIATDVYGLPEDCHVSKELVKVEAVIGEGEAQQQVENTFTLPKMAVEICDVVTDVRDYTTKVIDDKVIIQGYIYKQIFFVGLDNLVHHCLEKVKFETFVGIPGVKPGMEAIVDAFIEHISFDFFIPAGETCHNRIDQTMIVKAYVKVVQTVQVNVITDVTGPGVDLDSYLFSVNAVVGENATQTQVSNYFVLPRMASEIFDAKAECKKIEAEVINGKVVVEGVIEKQIYYVGADKIVNHAREEVKFDYFVDVPGALPGMDVHVKQKIENLQLNLNIPEGYDLGNRVDQNMIVQIAAKVTTEKQLPLITRLEVIAISPTIGLECPPSFSFYIVQPGDTLWKIAKRYSVALEVIIEANPQIEDPDVIYPGDKICIPLAQCQPLYVSGKG